MAKFKCINCGEVKESEKACSCSICGYRMFEAPYDRRNVLISEIENFISHLEVQSVIRSDLIFEGKEDDDNRFPGYDRILKYVSGKERTEDFLNCLQKTTEQLKLHFTAQFSKSYPVSFENLDCIIQKYDKVLVSAAEILSPDTSYKLEPVGWENVSLVYTENQNKYLWFSAHELIDCIEELAQKIVRFIKLNNLYGNIHKYHPNKRNEKFIKEIDYKDEIEDAITETHEVLCKQYVIDIADDGSNELKEMLDCLWHGIELIMCAPLFIKNFDYLMESGGISEKDLLEKLADKLKTRYSEFNEALNLSSILESKSEDELFDIYKQLIAIDKFGFLVPCGSELINIGESEKKLERLIGLSSIKENVRKIKAYALANQDHSDLNIHMCFYGNPGTGKTEVARIIAEILYENKILPTNTVVEVDRGGLVSQYVGETAIKTRNAIDSALGGVLFVDEAYALIPKNGSSGDYGHEAVATLLKAMEDNRGKFCVILAGYRNEMKRMLESNPGFKSRIQFELDFPNYSRTELGLIAKLMLDKRGYIVSEEVLSRILDITDIRRKSQNFANAREIRNILDQVIMCQNIRCIGTVDKELGMVDVNKYIKDANIRLPETGEAYKKELMSGEDELNALIGLSSVKRMVKKIKAYAKRNKEYADFNLHMCFYGNPGTGKTEVARIISRILYDAGVLNEAKLVETDAYGLIGKYVGETGPKTLAKIDSAMDGVLFIDEAYRLVPVGSNASGSSSYGEEAIAVLLKEMEDRRGQFCVVLAGYKNEMQEMISSNPGLESRIQFTLEFPDYNRDELGEIARLFLSKKGYVINEDAFDLVLDITDYFRHLPNFANARTVRNILDQVIMNQNLRTEETETDNIITMDDVRDYLKEVDIHLDEPLKEKHKMGFC